MKFINNNSWSLLLFALITLFLTGCEIEEVPDPNNLGFSVVEDGATAGQIQAVVDGIEHGMRERLGTYFDGVGVIGREWYRFSGSDPRFTSDLLGQGNAILDNNTFYTTNTFAQRYRTIKNCNVLLTAIPNVGFAITAPEIEATRGFANTIIAYELLMVLNQQYNNGVRVDVADPDNLGPFLDLNASLNAIADLLDQADDELQSAREAAFPFTLTQGFSGFDTPETFALFNRAIAARVDLYRQDWGGALDALEDSFLDLLGDLDAGPYHPFSTAGGDLTNPVWYPLNALGEQRVAHPSFLTDAEAGDARLSKVTERDETATQADLASDYDVTIYSGLSSPIPIIRNEELILIYAEASAQLDQTMNAVTAIDRIRMDSGGLVAYSGDTTKDGLIDEILNQRRYSLYGEGHRWVDMRRYDRLDELPIDREGDDVWVQFPRPATE